jgi:hypothetical protein
MLTQEFAQHFAAEWIDAWNARDLPRVLSHYDDDFEMASARIADIAGEPTGVLRGKEQVGAYWAKALRLLPNLHFELLGVFVAPCSLAIHYLNQAGRRVVETFEFAPSGVVLRAAAHYEPAETFDAIEPAARGGG